MARSSGRSVCLASPKKTALYVSCPNATSGINPGGRQTHRWKTQVPCEGL